MYAAPSTPSSPNRLYAWLRRMSPPLALALMMALSPSLVDAGDAPDAPSVTGSAPSVTGSAPSVTGSAPVAVVRTVSSAPNAVSDISTRVRNSNWDYFYDLMSPALLGAFVLVCLAWLRRRKYLFKDFAGERLLHIALVTLKAEGKLADEPVVTGEIVARLGGLERSFTSGGGPSPEKLPPLLLTLVRHPGFAELEELAAGSASDGPAFERLRAALSR